MHLGLKFLLVLILLTLAHLPFHACAQKFNFVQYNVEEGLAQSQAVAIRQDSMRHLWIATLGGICRFDGKNFSTYTSMDGLLSNFTSALHIDSRQHVWIGSQLGMSYYDGRKFSNFAFTPQRASASVVSAIVEVHGKIWAVFDQKLYLFDLSGKQLDIPPLLKAKPIAAIGTAGSNLLMALNDGTVHIFNGKDLNQLPVYNADKQSKLNVTKIYTAPSGNTWLLCDKYLALYDKGSYEIKLTSVPEQVVKESITVFEDRQGALWLGGHSGAFRIQGDNISHYNARSGLCDQQIRDIIQDVEGNIWFASNAAGIHKFSGDGLIYFDKTDLVNEVVVGLTKDRKGDLWFGSYGRGMSRYDGNRIYHYDFPTTNKASAIINFCYTDQSGDLWIGTVGGGLWRYSNQRFTNLSALKNLGQHTFNATASGDSGVMYFGSAKGLYRYARGEFEKLEESGGFIGSLDVLGDDSVLVGTAHGVELIHHGKKKPYLQSPDLSRALVFSITHSADKVFIGTLDKGIFIADRNGQNVKWISTAGGISSNSIYSLAVDKLGRLWASTGHYLNRISFNKDGTISNIRIFGRTAGINSAEGNANSLMIDGDYIWAGTTNGLYKMKITGTETIGMAPTLFLKDVRLFSMPVTDKQYFDTLSKFYGVPLALRLPYKKNHLTFEFQGISLSNPEDVKYQYYIQGLDKTFSEPLSTNSVIYSSIPPGRYKLVVKALLNESPELSSQMEYEFEITTPFHHTIYFRLLLVALLIVCGIIIQTFRSRIREKRRRVLDSIRNEEQQKIRKKTAEDFHDEMGNKVTRISLLSEILKDKSNDEEAVRKLVEQIKENAIGLYNGTRDVIWSLSTDSGNLLQVLNRIRDFGTDLFADSDIQFICIGLEQCSPKTTIPSDFSRNLTMIFKEGMNNILKYADCTRVTLTINAAFQDYIKITLHDNGKGFDINAAAAGHGIDNMRIRAARINGHISINTGTGTGTTIILKFRLP